ncbi:hypothetical protein [Sulfurimonas marina]|uniref:Uncharacterized protein n=1 Tax=Sulfurimonas marina TaxID=2590551 RepID=A0A7M1AUT0_9BACT|nr:hypothetical protein [Sulfurimonas marina]QOP41136.1 hypothetical protein FJR03_05015 [Sulfurimonas marina]
MVKKTFLTLISQIVLVFFLGSSYLSASHVHLDNTCDDTECELCIVVKNFQNISLDTPTDSSVFIPYSYEHIESETSIKLAINFKGFFSTAPPSSPLF